MASIDQIRVAVTTFFDREIRHTLPDAKGKLYGMAVGVAMAHPERTFAKLFAAARMMGAMDDDGDIDVELLAKEAKKNLFSGGEDFKMELAINPFKPGDVDVFKFSGGDVDKLLEYIRNA